MTRATVLTLVNRYLPGYKSGGPIRTVASLVETLGAEFDFKIVTSDRDAGDSGPYPGIRCGEWVTVGKAQVCYLPSSPWLCDRTILKIMRDVKYDILYLNSLLNPVFTTGPLLFRRLRLVPRRPTILAPRGELSPGALSLKARKKHAFLKVARGLNLYEDVLWQASSPKDVPDIQRAFGKNVRYMIAANMTAADRMSNNAVVRREPKHAGHLRAVFLSRISPVKNLLEAIRLIGEAGISAEFDIFGPADDQRYLELCQRAASQAPASVRIRFNGPRPHEDVAKILSGYDVFLLPTLGENFGHAIVEALLAGCPVLISDCTPWRSLERHEAGWDVPLADAAQYHEILRRLANMDEIEHARWREGAAKFGKVAIEAQAAAQATRALFECALMGGHI